MALRALLFSADGTSTSTLCQVLTELGIEAEICPELLVAIQRVSLETYDAILADWDEEADAIALLKAVREQKIASLALNLALVRNDKDLPRALQHGAHSVIRKPIDAQQASDTLSTARELILSRRSEQKAKVERAAAAQAAIAAAAAELEAAEDAPAPKTGFVSQTATRSAWDAAQSSENQDTAQEPQSRQSAPVSLPQEEPETQAEEIHPVRGNKRWDDKPKPQETVAVEVTPPKPEFACAESAPTHDATGVFSSLPEEEEAQPRSEKHSYPRFLMFALAGCVLVAAVLWVLAPGSLYQSVLNSTLRLFHKDVHPAEAQPAPATSSSATPAPPEDEPVQPPPPSAAPEEIPPADPGPVETSEADPGKLQVIETKSIPKPGAQQPPATDSPADAEQAPAKAEPITSADGNSGTVPPSPAVQPAVPPVVQPAVATTSKPQTQIAVAVQQSSPAPSAGRTGVIIPDSLKTSPSKAAVNSVDSGVVPEETSRNLIEHRVEPDYPAQALPQRLQGPVVLQVWVGKDGSVQDVKLVRGYFVLARAAFDAVRQWHFKPYAPNGKPVDFQTVVTLNFKYPG
jgi:TonB family protein